MNVISHGLACLLRKVEIDSGRFRGLRVGFLLFESLFVVLNAFLDDFVVCF